MADATLDAKGLNCPLPILKARKALKDVADGGTLEILATDPGAVADFEDAVIIEVEGVVEAGCCVGHRGV